MPFRVYRIACFLGAVGLLYTTGIAGLHAETLGKPPRAEFDFFENRIRPLLVEHCYECHSIQSGESMGDLRLDSAAAMLRGGSLGPTLSAGNPDGSLLMRAVGYDEPDLQMPPEGKLPDEAIESLRIWIQRGAADPRQDPEEAGTDQSGSPADREITSHWAFVPPRKIAPASRTTDFSGAMDHRDIIDEAASQIASAEGLTSNPAASKAVLIRRLSFDLTGLPVSAEQLRAGKASRRPDDMTRRVDRMLADPAFAERFGRHWLDVARYADTKGYALAGKSRDLTGAYRYRDWVLRSFAEDMPFDEMIRHQLAADQTDPDNQSGHADAMGFLTVGRQFLRYDDTLDDRIDVISRGLLGLTVSCSRCHDHKFDPIPSVDYYSLYNVLHNSVPPEAPEKASSPLMLIDRPKLADVRVFIRGDRSRKGDVAPRQYLTAFRNRDNELFQKGSGRLELAERIASPENPLTSRVWVNRIWGHLMGRPLVDSPSDFGFRTDRPPLGDVLDDLAVTFAEDFSTKRLIRRIVRSRLYSQSSKVSELQATTDSENVLWTHALRRRRDFESLRDRLLVSCNYIDRQFGGVSQEISGPALTPRRTLYAFIDRQNLPGLFRTFDFANPDMHSPRRYFTTVPQQSLFLMNHPQVADAAFRVAERVGEANPSEQVERLFELTLGRLPSEHERTDGLAFLQSPAELSALAFDPQFLWHYGTATWKHDRIEAFRPLTMFENNQWQVEKEFPSPGPLSYASLGRENGHPAQGDDGVVVRRWVSPADGTIRITGMVGHRSDQGDGVIAIVQVGGKTLFEETQKSNNRPLRNIQGPIQKGDAVDLIVHSGPSLSFDSFFWRAKLSLETHDGLHIEADSVGDFSGKRSSDLGKFPRSLSRLAQLAQVLMLTNEFAFVD